MDPVTVHWPGGEHRFALDIGKLRALQKNCDAGPEEIWLRLQLGTWRIDDIIETLRLGLIGGGDVDDAEAGRLVINTFEQMPRMALRQAAFQVLNDALGMEADDPLGELTGAMAPQANGDSASSTPSDQ